MVNSKLVYMASPYSGDVENNVAFAKAACHYAMEQGVTPLASHLLYPQLLDDAVPEERKLGTEMGIRLLKACDEIWVCGSHISQGMEQEILAAKQFGIPMKQVSEQKIGYGQSMASLQTGMGMRG